MTPRIPRKLIAEKTAEVFGITFLDLISHRRQAKYQPARRAAYYLIRELRPDTSMPAIGRMLDRDHTTIIYGIRKAVRLLKTDDAFRARLEMAREAILVPPAAESLAAEIEPEAPKVAQEPETPPEAKIEPTKRELKKAKRLGRVSAMPFSERWWTQNEEMFRHAMQEAHPELMPQKLLAAE